MTGFPVSAELWSVAEMALAYALDAAKRSKGEPFEPALVTETAEGERTLSQLALLLVPAADPFEVAKQRLRGIPDALRAAVAMDGNLAIADVSEDAVIIVVGERGSASNRFALRYRRKRLGHFETVGNLGYMGEEPSIFA